MSASAYGNYPSEIVHYYRCIAIRVGAIPKLAIIVVAPSHHRPIALDCQGVILAGGNANGVSHPDGQYRHIAGICCPVAKLAVVIVPPVPNCSVSL